LRRLDVKRAPRIAIEQMPQLCNDSHSQLKGIASFLSHFSSSVTASQPFSQDDLDRKPGCPVLPFATSFTAGVSVRLVAARRRWLNLLRLEL
jgi:hypothetical protein